MDAKIKELLTDLSFFAEDGMGEPKLVEFAKKADALLMEMVKKQNAQQPVAWCEHTQSVGIGYFDGKPMIMVGDVGNDCHQTPLYTAPPVPRDVPRDVLMAVAEEVQAAVKNAARTEYKKYACEDEVVYDAIDLAAIADRYASKVQPEPTRVLTDDELWQLFWRDTEVLATGAIVGLKEALRRVHQAGAVATKPDPVNQQTLAALKDIASDYADRFDLFSSSTNPGIKIVIEQARVAIAAAEAAQPVGQDERAAFEKWFRREVGMPDFVDFDQTAPWAEFAFKAWSARAAQQPASAQPVAVPDAGDSEEWRRLALQFDGHRMQALSHLRCLLDNPESHAEAARAFLAAPPLSGEQVLTERIAAMCQSTDDWQPSGIDYDRSMHSNPDAGAWANFFVETFPALKGKEGLMLGWFANAMMAMHDHLLAQPPAVAVPDEITVSMAPHSQYAKGWNACRSATLSAAKKPEGV